MTNNSIEHDLKGMIIGCDFGIKRIGVAIGNSLTYTAQPLTIIDSHQGNPDWKIFQEIINQWQVCAIVIGMPYTADGNKTQNIIEIEKFRKKLEEHFHLPTFLEDEFQSSIESVSIIEKLEEVRVQNTRKKRSHNKNKKEYIDHIAAAIILERWLSKFASQPKND